MGEENSLSSRPDLIAALEQETQGQWQRGYYQAMNLIRHLDHDLREERNKVVLLMNILAQLRDNPNAVADRVDRVLGRVVD